MRGTFRAKNPPYYGEIEGKSRGKIVKKQTGFALKNVVMKSEK